MEHIRLKRASFREGGRLWLTRIACLLAGLYAGASPAAPAEILLLGDGSALHARIATAARAELTALGSEVALREVGREGLQDALAGPAPPVLVVTLGTRAAQSLHGSLPVPVLHAAIAASLYPQLDASAGPASHQHAHSALYLDQPAPRQIAALRLALPQLQRLGVLASAGRETLIGPLVTAARDVGLEVVDAVVPEEGLLIPRVEQLLRYADALLITPDPTLYNRYSLQKVLLAAYRQRKPVIGLSEAYVKAGALLAVHADPETIGRDLALSLSRFVERGRLDPPTLSRGYAIAINHQVARSLGLNPPAEEALFEALRQHEEGR